MMAWEWIAVGVAAPIGLSIALALVLGRILGTINDGASRLLEDERWKSAAVTHKTGPSLDDRQPRRAGRQAVGLRARN
jgi:hypothetical protein